MAKWDKEYLKLCKKILTEGVEVENRTGINTIKIPSYDFHFDLSEEFPILTTKQLFIRQAVLEMMWIYQVSSNDVRWLQDRNVHIWDEWEIDEDGVYRTYEPEENYDEVDKEVEIYDTKGRLLLDCEGKVMTTSSTDNMKEKGKVITSAKYFGEDWAHTIGTAYGYIVDKFNLTDGLLDSIINNPNDRRKIVSLWQNDYLDTAVLPSCVWSSEWDVTDGKLNAWVHQRSCDVPLGLPFNVTQYSVLLSMLAKEAGLEPGTLDWSIKDAHIYVNQVDGIKEQITRGEELPDLPAPELWLNPEVKRFKDYDNSKECRDVKVLNYKHHGKISFPLAR